MTEKIYKEQVEDVFVLKSVYNIDMANKADIDGNLTTGGIWFQDQVLSDRFSTNKQVWTAFTNNTIEFGNVDLNKVTLISNGINSFKTKVGVAEYTIYHSGNLDVNDFAKKDGSNATGALASTISNSHTHSNKTVIDSITAQDLISWADAVALMHSHANKSVLDSITAAKVSNWDTASANNHIHANKAILDAITAAFTAADDNLLNALGGLQFESDQTTATLRIKDGNGNVLTSISLAYLNNEGTQFVYNPTNNTLDLLNDAGQILSSIPVSSFVTNLVSNANWNGTTPTKLDFKDNSGVVLFSIDYTISNVQGLQAVLDGKQTALSNGLHTTLNTNKVDVAFEVNTPIKDKANNDRLIFGNTQATDVVIKGAVANGNFVVKDSTNTDLFRIDGANKVPYFPQLPAAQTSGNGNIAYFDAVNGIWKSNVNVGDLALASQIPANFITSNTAQSGLTGDKTTSGNWTFLESSININRTNLTSSHGLRFRTNGLLRWNIHPSNEVSGSNDVLYFSRYDDSGVYLGYSLGLNRQNGTVSSQGSFIIAGRSNSDILLAGGGHRPVSDFALSSSVSNFFTTNYNNSTNSTTFQGNLLAVPTGTYSAAVSGSSTNLPFGGVAGGLISFGNTTVSTRILGARDNSDNLWFQSGDGTGAWRQLASRTWADSKFALTSSLGNYYQSNDVNIPTKGGDYRVFPYGESAVTFDFNNITGHGFYKNMSNVGSTNAPKGGYWYVENLQYGTTGNLTQYAHPYRVEDGKWMRNRYNGTWTPWVQFVHSGNLESYALSLGFAKGNFANYLPLTGGSLSGALTILPSGSNAVLEQDVLILRDLGTASGNVIPITFEFGTAGNKSYFKGVAKGSDAVNGVTFGFYDGTTRHTSIDSVTGVTSTKFVKTGGTASQFLKADGSVDTNTYVTSSSLSGFLPLTGGSLTGSLEISTTGGNTALALNANGNGQSELLQIHSSGLSGFRVGTIVNLSNVLDYYYHITPMTGTRGDTFKILHNGNIGIGEQSPTAKLHVNGNIIATDGTATNHVVTLNQLNTKANTSGTYPNLNVGNSDKWQGLMFDYASPTTANFFLIQEGILCRRMTVADVKTLLGIPVSGYAMLGAAQTFTNINSFTQSPIIPDGTQPNHAVSKQQLDDAVSTATSQVTNLFGGISNYFQDLDVSGGGLFPTDEYFFTLMDPNNTSTSVDVGDHNLNGARLVLHSPHSSAVTYNGKFRVGGTTVSSIVLENNLKKEFVWTDSMNSWREVF